VPIQVQAPNGDIVEFPDGTPDDVMAKAMQATYGVTQQQPSVAGDIAKSAGVGVAKGTIGIAGLPGDVESLIKPYLPSDQSINNAVAGMGLDPNGLAGRLARGAFSSNGAQLPSSADIQGKIEDNVTGKFYQPQTGAGRLAETLGEFAPGLATGGAAGLTKEGVGLLTKEGLGIAAKELGKRAVLDVAAPALGSEAAGAATQGTAYEPYGRLAGALLGGGLAHAGASMMDAKPPSMGAITDKAIDASNMADTIKSAAQDAYKAADDAGVVLAPQGMQNAFTAMKDSVLADSGLPKINKVFADNFPNIKAKIGALDDVAKGPVSLMGLDKLRQTLRDLPASASDAEQRYANQMVKGLDSYVENLSPADVVSANGPTQEAVDALTNARQMYRSSANLADKTKIVSDAIERAKDLAGANSTANDLNTKIRQQFRQIKDKMRKDDDVANLFSDDEKNLINNVVNGTDAENSMRYWSKFVPDKLLNYGIAGGLGGAALSALSGPVGQGLGGAGALASTLIKGGQALAAQGAENAQRGTLDDLMNTLMNDGKFVPSGRPAPTTVPRKLADTLAAGGRIGVLGTSGARTGN
jgi:hypothetical protein